MPSQELFVSTSYLRWKQTAPSASRDIKTKYKMKHIDVEGLILPNESLSNFQLIEAAKKLGIKNFRGVFVRDELPKKCNVAECGIVNTGDSTTNGFHWMCWYKNGDYKICFDSYALPPPVELVRYLKQPVFYNSERVQYGDTVFCGHLCLYVLKKLCEGVDFQVILNGLW